MFWRSAEKGVGIMSKDNLYIIGFPRSASTLINRICNIALDCHYDGVDGGEFLNPDRVFRPLDGEHKALAETMTGNHHRFWTDRHKNIQLAFLDHLHEMDTQLIIKDVCYPHIVMEHVKKHEAKCLLVEKDVVLTAYSLVKNGWFYPTYFLQSKEPTGIERIEKLLEALETMRLRLGSLKDLSHVRTITAEEINGDERAIFEKLEELGFKPRKFGYLSPALVDKAKSVEMYKDTKLYREIEEIWKRMRKEALNNEIDKMPDS